MANLNNFMFKVKDYNKNKSNFTVVQRHASNDRNGVYTTGYPFNWFAIGRWK